MGGRGASSRGGVGGGKSNSLAKQEERIKIASANIGNAIKEYNEKGYITSLPINVGKVENEVARHAKSIGKPLENNTMYFTGNALVHSMRDMKQNEGIAVSAKDFKAFPKTKSSMKVYYDKSTGNYTYTNGKNKFVLQPNVRVKLKNGKKSVVSLVTATKMRSVDEFNMGKYELIKG